MMTKLNWRKASASGAEGACVELACEPRSRRVRDSKNPAGPQLVFPATAVGRLLSAMKAS